MESFNSIVQQFPSLSPEQWKAKIIADLKGGAFDRLITHVEENIEVLPFYTKEDNAHYQLNIPAKQREGWLITERIQVDTIESANAQALLALQMGANAILFDAQGQDLSEEAIHQLKEGILTDIAPVFFEHLPNGETCKVIVPHLQYASDELVFALTQGLQTDFSSKQFHFYTGTNYFIEMAKLRAFRWLWKQLCMLKERPFELFIFSETLVQDTTEGSIYDNMLRNTTEAMSAILGGCDGLIINSHEATPTSSEFGRRIARNIHHILQQESNFNNMEEAVTGAYYVEYLTYQLAQKAWEQFRTSVSI
jgi:methylmalonyl-CoA mutase